MEGETYVVVGTVKDLVQYPERSFAGGFLRTYRLNQQAQLELVHAVSVWIVLLHLRSLFDVCCVMFCQSSSLMRCFFLFL